MRQPNPLDYLAGHILCLAALWGATLVSAYSWWLNGTTIFAPLLLFAVASYSGRASVRVAKYRRWQREWNAMGGEGGSARRGLGFGWVGRLLKASKPKADPPVSVCAPRFSRSPAVADAFPLLPAYCHEVLQSAAHEPH